MVSQDDLDSAIADLRDRLAAGFSAELLAEVADDWGVRPELLSRKFAEKLGALPQNYIAGNRDATALGVTLSAMGSDQHLFSMAQRVLELRSGPRKGWIFISGLVLQDMTGRKIVLRAVSWPVIHFFPLGSTHPEKSSLRQLFGDQERLAEKISVAEPSRIVPDGFDEWVKNRVAAGLDPSQSEE
ncbi:hypothetical protein ACEUZ9_002890 [Paracoccus litorisediminis]|uniref:hypothetical protein n=1 Tax=Paracoccus litorisediminis TaxID=2006130 RepID=UPI00372DD252